MKGLKMFRGPSRESDVRYFTNESYLNKAGQMQVSLRDRPGFTLISRRVRPHREDIVQAAMATGVRHMILIMPEGGPIIFTVGRKEMVVHPTQYGLLYVDQAYSVKTIPQPFATHRLTVWFSMPFLQESWRLIGGKTGGWPVLETGVRGRSLYLNNVLRLLFQESTNRKGPPFLQAETLMRQLAHWLFYHHPHDRHASLGEPVLAPVDDPKVQEAIRYLQDHMVDRQVVRQAAKASGMHFNTLITRMRTATGLSPVEYLQRYRMERAQALLRETADPVTEVSAAVGYESLSHFSKAFQRYAGVTPMEFRRRTPK